MNDSLSKRIRFRFHGKRYDLRIESRNYEDMIIVNKLLIGKSRLWLILQNQTWRFISDMPLCRELKSIVVKKIAALNGKTDAQYFKIAEQTPVRKGIMLNAILSVLVVKKELL